MQKESRGPWWWLQPGNVPSVGQGMDTWAGSLLPTTELMGPPLPQYWATGSDVQGQRRQYTDLGAGSVCPQQISSLCLSFLVSIMGVAVSRRAFVLGTCSAGGSRPWPPGSQGKAGHKRALTHVSVGQTQSHGFSLLPPMKRSEASGTRPVLGGGCAEDGSGLGLEKPIKALTRSFGPGSRPWKLLEASPPGALFCLSPPVRQGPGQCPALGTFAP